MAAFRKFLPNRGEQNLKPGLMKGKKLGPYKDRLDPKAKSIANKLIERPAYRKHLQDALDDGSLHPSLQVMLWQYAYGKPKEEVEIKPIVPVTITHEYES